MGSNNDRLEFVAELTLLGFSPEKIAERLGVSVGIVKSDLERIRIKWQENRQKSYAQFIEEELATQRMLMQALETGIKQGSWKHVETALKITERRARVMGLDHTDRMDQARVEIEARQLDMISSALERVMDALGLSEEQRELATSTLILELEAGDIELADD
jgi:transcription initiation factor TFIIIB Brf1 subunit/transcription initiation factor TFIIB